MGAAVANFAGPLKILLHELLDRQNAIASLKTAPSGELHLQRAIQLVLRFAILKVHLIAKSQQILIANFERVLIFRR